MVTVLGAGLPKITILNILLPQSPLFQEHAFPKHSSRVSAAKGLLLPASLGLFGCFSACWNAPFRRNSARLGARFSAFFGTFRRFSAFFGVFRRFSAHARGEINRAFWRVAGGGVTTPSKVLTLERHVCVCANNVCYATRTAA